MRDAEHDPPASLPGRLWLHRGAPTAERILAAAGWRETRGADWDLYWRPQVPSAAVYRHLRAGARVNHFPGIAALTSPRRLARALARCRAALQGRATAPRFDFYPETYALPEELADFREAAATRGGPWLRRPLPLASDRERRQLEGPDALTPGDACLVERCRPPSAPAAGRSPVLHRFVLLTSVDPLEVYIHPSGWVEMDGAQPLTLDAHWEARRRAGEDPAALQRALDALVVTCMVAAQDEVARATEAVAVRPGACFELLRFDLTLDDDQRPGLLACQLCPDADGDEAVLTDVLHLTGLVAAAGACGFRRLVPGEPDQLDWFPLPRWRDLLAFRDLHPSLRAEQPTFAARAAQSWFLDGELVIHGGWEPQLHLPNPTGAYVWVRCLDGLTPHAIGEELARQFPEERARVQGDVWNTLARHVHDGLLRVVGDGTEDPTAVERPVAALAPPLPAPAFTCTYRVLEQHLTVGFDAREAAQLVSQLWRPEPEPPAGAATRAAPHCVVQTRGARHTVYRADGTIVTCSGSATLAPVVRAELLRCACAARDAERVAPATGTELTVRGAAVTGGAATLLAVGGEQEGASLLGALAETTGRDLVTDEITRLDLPAGRVHRATTGYALLDADAAALAPWRPDLQALDVHAWPTGRRVRFVPRVPPRSTSEPPPVRALVFPMRGAPGLPCRLSVVPRRDALQRVVPHLLGPLDAARVAALVAWLQTVDCAELTLGDTVPTLGLLGSLLE